MLERFLQLLLALLIIPSVVILYLLAVESLLRLLPEKSRQRVRPWLWSAPALLFLFTFLVYPTLNTIYLSFFDAKSKTFVGLNNYLYIFTSQDMQIALRNNGLWLVLFTLLTVALGLLMAVLTNRVSYESVAKSIIFLPMAISFVAAGVIWKFMFDYRPPGSPQTGTLNALWTSLTGSDPQPWLINPLTNNAALIIAAVWMFAGFCMVLLSAGLKGIPNDYIEAAQLDGANGWQVFTRVLIPLLMPTITVVATTMVISSLKIFDIVYVLTNGNYNTDVIATQMYKELFSSRHFGRASAIAVLLLVVTVPIMVANIRTFRSQEVA
jgi:alpha-glucoside transport system permease protein